MGFLKSKIEINLDMGTLLNRFFDFKKNLSIVT